MSFNQELLKWYDKNGRKDLPWRQDICAYKVWLSEIMLQQTQVKTVLPYFQRFLTHFPSVIELANAAIDDVLHLWAGLGYYARARNLHKTAQLIASDYQGEFPNEVAKLIKLPGIGLSTAGAISAIVFNQAEPILDGNVKRVLTRLYAISGWPGKTDIAKKLWKIAASLTPKNRASDYTQAIMDLGATICTRSQPQCNVCPLTQLCQAYQTQTISQYPQAKPKKEKPTKEVIMLILENDQNAILLTKRPPVGIWGGLWSLPECALDANIDEVCLENYAAKIISKTKLAAFRHTFTHYHLIINPFKLKIELSTTQIMENSAYFWYKHGMENKLGLPAPITYILKEIHK